MPRGNVIDDMLDRLHRQRIERREKKNELLKFLPPDLTGHVLLKCREEAEKVRAYMDKLVAQCEQLQVDIKEGERQARAKCQNLTAPDRVKGDILGKFEVQPPTEDPLRWRKTPEALEYQREHVDPLRWRLAALQRAVTGCEQDLHQLRKIANKAFEGDVALIHFLSAQWLNRLEIGPGVEGTMARLVSYHAVPVDILGDPLPQEALDKDGEPDFATMGPAAARAWRAEHGAAHD